MAKMRDWMEAPMRSHVESEKLLRMMARFAVVAMLCEENGVKRKGGKEERRKQLS